MVKPWLDSGYDCWIVDNQHPAGEHREGNLVRVGADILRWLPPRRRYAAAFSFTPCDNLAVSGARWFKDKGLAGLAAGLALAERGAEICQWTEAPWFQENPVSTLKSYWRSPDYYFHPWEYAGYLPADYRNPSKPNLIGPEVENYNKKTCLWTGGGFIMPEPRPLPAPHRNDIHLAPPSDDRADLRSATPCGFATAVFQANGVSQ